MTNNIEMMTKQAEFVANIYDRALAGVPILDGRDGDRDLDKECGYPDVITPAEYMRMYRRGDVAHRVVNLEPDECWKEYPLIYETEEERETAFEKAVDRLVQSTRLFSYLHRLDRVSGIGRFGVLLVGLDDGNDLETPAPGYDVHSAVQRSSDAKVLYYRVLGESSVTIVEHESDKKNARYGHPLYYNLLVQEQVDATTTTSENLRVHWSRVIHVADNLIESELYGSPRQEAVYNRLLDLRKVAGGSGEMFWKGGFPGLSFEVDPKHGDFSTEERDALREDVRAYAEGLQRYITMVGVSVKSLEPQISDPTNHTKNLLMLIAISKGMPMQSFMGSQQGQLDSPQDTITWKERIALRKERHVTPNIIRPVIDRFIQYGALPEPVAQLDQPNPYIVKWEAMAALNEMERAQVAKDLTEALARYSTAGGEALVPRAEFLGKFLGFSAQEVQAIENAAPTRHSVVFQELAGMTGSAGGNKPSSIPKRPKASQKKDPSKTPVNVVQKAKK